MLNYGEGQDKDGIVKEPPGIFAKNALPENIGLPSIENFEKGVKPLDKYPAAWMNALNNIYTSHMKKVSECFSDIYRELLSVLTAAGVQPDKAMGDRLSTAIDNLINNMVEPVSTLLNSHKENESNPHGVTKAQVGLGNADNTSDINKPISTATQEAIDTEITARQNADIALGKRIDSQEGQGGYLNAHDFGKANPTLEEFLTYYCSEIWGSGVFAYNGTDPKNSTLTTPDGTVHYCYEIFNSTSVHNLFNNHKWILTNTPSTTPPAFAIADVGEDIVGSATDTYAGVSKLYNATGGNVDGAMTQAAATSAMNSETNAAQVLAKLLTVDGANSGLDADLLDGQQGAYYQNAGNLNAGTIPAGRMPAHTGDVTSTAGGVALTLVAAQVLAKLLTVDGANSGLDADKLDGQEGAAYVNTSNNQTIAGTKSFSTSPLGVSNLGKLNDGVTVANIFANPPLNNMGAISYHHFDANFPVEYKTPLQSGGAESWDIITLNLISNRAKQIATQNFNFGNQNRTFIRSRHIDNYDYSQWQAWVEITKQGDNATFLNLTVDSLIQTSIIDFIKVPSNAGYGGYIDFHFNGSSVDYTSRIIEDASGQISIYGGKLNVGGSVYANTPPLPF
jgi:hypothetical protein